MSPDNPDESHQPGISIQEARPKVEEPPKYQVVLLNDDYTPMDFVVEVLERFFAMSRPQATRVMLQVHLEGRGVAGVYTAEIAETKVALVNDYARANEYPLMTVMEKV